MPISAQAPCGSTSVSSHSARCCCFAMQAFEKPFKEYWATTVYPAIQDDFERLLQTTPKRIAKKHERDTAEKAEKAEKIKEQAENNKEKKNKSEEENAPELQQPEGKKKEKNIQCGRRSLRSSKRRRTRASAGMRI